MRNLIIILYVFVHNSLFAQDVVFSTAGQRIYNEGSDSFLLVDVMAYSNQGFKVGDGQFYLNYDTTSLGSNAFANGNLTFIIPSNSILSKTIGQSPTLFNFYKNFILNDNTINRVSFSWQHNFSQTCLDSINISNYLDVFVVLKFKLKDNYVEDIPLVCLEQNEVFLHQIFTACGPNVCNVNDCITHPGVQLLNDQYPCSDCHIVYSIEDSGPGSLRNAISCSLPGDTIRFAHSLRMDSIKLVSDSILLDIPLSILAKKDFQIFIDGSNINRVFTIAPHTNIHISNLNIIGGTNVKGNSIENMGNLILEDVVLYYSQNSSNTSQILNLGNLDIKGKVKVLSY